MGDKNVIKKKRERKRESADTIIVAVKWKWWSNDVYTYEEIGSNKRIQ